MRNRHGRGDSNLSQGLVQLEHIEAIEKRLWNAADTLRSNSNYASNEYFMPVMGLIFLRYAYSRYLAVKADFVMANPPFNVDEVDADKVKNDPRPPFGLPGVNKNEKVSNGNYLWISYFYSYLNETGRAGFVMSSQASIAGRDEAKVRRKLIEIGDVDIMIAIRSNFFYTRTVTERFPEGELRDVEGLVKLVDRTELAANDYSLTPGRCVGVAAEVEDDGFDFEEALRDIHVELEGLNAEAAELAARISRNFKELGI